MSVNMESILMEYAAVSYRLRSQTKTNKIASKATPRLHYINCFYDTLFNCIVMYCIVLHCIVYCCIMNY